ncbi:hypothetical protein BJX96DRAFT_180220 [Aspergillus floccosus]
MSLRLFVFITSSVPLTYNSLLISNMVDKVPDIDNPAQYICLRDTMGPTCILRRCAQWLWSTWTVSSPSALSTLPESTGCAPDLPVEEVARSAYPCKACQAWGVTCDRQQPRCAHCLDQQILCFYVAPPLRATKSRRKPKQQPVQA